MTAVTAMVETATLTATATAMATATATMLPPPPMAKILMMTTAAFEDGYWMTGIG
jgi:hypothetical protein